MTEYRHKIGGAVGDKSHEPGDPVDPATKPSKIKEWLAAGIIEKTTAKAKTTKVSKEKT